MNSDLNNLIVIFNQMDNDGWDTTSQLKWGFYFVDSDKEKLQNVFSELEDKNYVLEAVDLAEDKKWVLQASKFDTLTPEKLHRRNLAFNELADYCEVDLYDGWDVEKIEE